MALRGNLKDFSLPDVFQLVTFSRKTGVLRIQREDGAEGSVWFRDGDVFFAQSNWHTEPLGERLVKAQRITPQALKRALDVRSGEPEDGRRLGQILIDEGYITEKVLEAFVSEQIQDTIFDLMRWDEGEFDFEAMPAVVDEDIGLSVSIENVVMEGARRLEEWTRIKKKIPSMDVVFKMATAPGEGTFEISLKPIEWQLLLLVDGTRGVADLAHETTRTDFEVARIVYGLFSAGLLEFATEEEIAANRAERAEREARQAELEAQRKAAEQAQQREALEREAKLAEEAAARQAAAEKAAEKAAAEQRAADEAAEKRAAEAEKAAAEAESAEKAAAAEAEAAAAAPSVPEATEVPEFLGSSVVTPTADDQAVLEQFMGAVLEQHATEVSEPEPTPDVPAYVPGEEPPFVALSHDEDTDDAVVSVPSVEALLGMDVPVAPARPVDMSVEDMDIEDTAAAVPDTPDATAPEATALDAAVPTDEPAGEEFARDLMALGLGELPSDLLSPVSADDADAESWTPAVEVEDVDGPVVEIEYVAEPMSEAATWLESPIADAGLDVSLTALSGVDGSGAPEEPVEAVDELAALSASLDLPHEVPTGEATPLEDVDEAPDFSALLDSLDVDADIEPTVAESSHADVPDAAVVAVPVEEPDSGFDAELLLDEPGASGGVISTDAFLEDISIEDIGFSGSLNDELSALTGADRRGAQRPQASVNAIPEAGSGQLHRDTRVDKDTLLKIIDGIKNL